MKRFLLIMFFLLGFLAEKAIAQPVTHAVLLEIDSFAFRSQLSVAAENNVWELAQTLSLVENAPYMTLAFGKGGSEANPLMYSPKVNTPKALELLLSEAFANTNSEDVLLLYICTHGIYEENGTIGLILSDGRTDTILTGDQLASMLNAYSGQKVLILDACHSGALIGYGANEKDSLNPFGNDVSILTSSRATEDSWYWIENSDSTQGSFFFTNQLCLGLNASNGSPADGNDDGMVSLRELYGYLLESHGASTPVLIDRQKDDAFLIPKSGEQSPEPLRDIVFSMDYLKNNPLLLEMTAFRPISLAYRMAGWENNGWNLPEAKVFYDEGKDYAISTLAGGVRPGRINRAFDFSGTTSDYILLQIITNEEGKLTAPASHVIALLGEPCDLQADILFLEEGKLRLRIHHEKPALFTVVMKGENQERRILTRCASRPSPNNTSEYIIDTDNVHGKVFFSIEADFAQEKRYVTTNEIVLP